MTRPIYYLKLLSEGMSVREIATKYRRSERTIERDLSKITKNYKSKIHAVAELIKDGSIK